MSHVVVAENSGHTIPLDEPAVVAGVGGRLLATVRNDRLAKGDGQ